MKKMKAILALESAEDEEREADELMRNAESEDLDEPKKDGASPKTTPENSESDEEDLGGQINDLVEGQKKLEKELSDLKD